MKSSLKSVIYIILAIFLFYGCCFAHFGMVIPSDNMVMQGDSRQITLNLSFSHPFEMIGMEMVQPASFFVAAKGKQIELAEKLSKQQVMGHMAWQINYPIKRPGTYAFCMRPEPYWEPSEDCYIVHYTKTVVAAFGDDDGWDSEIGMKTEIIPLTKPFGLYAGNLFQGVVKLDGKAVPHSEVEVEFYNQEKKVNAPTDYMITQTIKSDANGVFSYAAPKPGWWGFAALNISDEKIDRDGKKKDVEIGAVIWVKFEQWQEK